MMNNRHSSIESYVPSMTSFVGLEGSTQKQHHLWDYETAATQHTAAIANHGQNYPFLTSNQFLDCQLPLLPMNNLSYFSPQPPMPVSYHDEDLIGGGPGGQIGLNLGHRTYFSSGDALALGRLWGRGRGVYAFGHHQPPRCQVEGCGADLSGAKHYHRRHKVCEFHSKAPLVMLAGGNQQRFCQQCSRFHVLSEFDEAKRSCRKRLADHNQRRRKQKRPPSATTSSSSKNTPAEKWKPTPKPASRDQSIKYCNTATTKSSSPTTAGSTICASTNLGGGQNKVTQLRNGPALSLGGVGEGKEVIFGSGGTAHYNQQEPYLGISKEMPSSAQQQQQQQLEEHFSSRLFQHHSLLSTSSNEASQSIGGTSDMTHHQQSSLLQLGQALFEVDFL